MIFVQFLLIFGIFLSACGSGFSVPAKKATTYVGSPAEYCSFPRNFEGLPASESIPTHDQLPEVRELAASYISQGKLQEAIWLYQEDPDNENKAVTLKKQLFGILNSDEFEVQDGSYLGGAFEKYVLTFSSGVKAIFKPTEAVYTEIAAYQLDELVGFGLVPMTLERKINGRKGTVQYYVTEMSPASVTQVSSKNFRRMMIFDFLIRNRDRDLNNFLYWPSQNRIIAIDHGAAFSLHCGIPDEIKASLVIEQTLSRRLSRLTERQLAVALYEIPVSIQKIIWKQISVIK